MIDDGNHRINFRTKYRRINLCDSLVKFDFRCIYSQNQESIDRAIDVVGNLWNLMNGRNEMRVE